MKNYSISYLLFILIFLFPFNILNSQNQDELKEMFIEAESYFLFEEYKDALPLYIQIKQKDPDNANIDYKIGICYLNDKYQKHKSIEYLLRATKNTSEKYKVNSYKERMAPVEAYYYLGNAYRVNNMLNDALKTYKKFLEIMDRDVYDTELVNDQIKACEIARKLQNRPIYFTYENLGEFINSKNAEINPIVSGDGNTIIYNAKLPFYDAVFYSKKDKDGNWSPPLNLTPFFKKDDDVYATGLSYNGDLLFVYCNDQFDGNIYRSRLVNGEWTKLEPFTDINTKYWESHASISADGKTLYFTSNRKGSYGELDIYVSKKTASGGWSSPENIGPTINSKYNEECPFVTEDGKTLFFSSYDHYNMGGYDIFYSTLMNNGEWSKPINIGYPLNTPDDDLFFSPVGDGYTAYYSAFNFGRTFGLDDIFKIEIFNDVHPRKFVINGIVNIKDNVKIDYKDISVYLYNKSLGKLVAQTGISKDGKYTIDATQGNFRLVIEGKNIETIEKDIHIPIDRESDLITETNLLTAVKEPDEEPEKSAKAPILNIDKDIYVVDKMKPLSIIIDVIKDADLTIETIYQNELINSENFRTAKNKFTYKFVPQVGTNILRFKIVDDEGNFKNDSIIINYLPKDQLLLAEITSKESGKVIFNPDLYPESELTDYIKSKKTDLSSPSSVIELYKELLEDSGSGKIKTTEKEINDFFIGILTQKNSESFYYEMLNASEGSLKDYIKRNEQLLVNLQPLELIYLLIKKSETEEFTREDILRSLLKIITKGSDDAQAILDELIRYLEDDAENNADLKKLAANNNLSFEELYNYLITNIDNEKLWEAIVKAAVSDEPDIFYNNLLFASRKNYRELLLNVNLNDGSVNNTTDLMNYLLSNCRKYELNKEQIIEFVLLSNQNEYYNTQLFAEFFKSYATGNLKEFLDSINLQNEGLQTISGYFDYIISSAKNNKYTTEDVYNTILRIIDPGNLDEFVADIKKYADTDLQNTIDKIDRSRFNNAFAFLQYILTHADELSIDIHDINDILLKLMLEKGLDQSGENYLLYSKERSLISKNLLISSGIVIVSIILLLVFLIYRKKRKRK